MKSGSIISCAACDMQQMGLALLHEIASSAPQRNLGIEDRGVEAHFDERVLSAFWLQAKARKVLRSRALGSMSGLRPDMGTRAVRRLLLGFVLSFVALCLLYSSSNKIAEYGSLLSDVPRELDLTSKATEEVEFFDPITPEKAPTIAPLVSFTEQSCRESRDAYRAFVDSRIQTNIVRLTSDGQLIGKSFEMAQSQGLFSDICWTAIDRYGHYSEKVDPAYLRCNALNQATNRTAVIIRLEPNHLFTEDAKLNLRALILEVGWYLGLDVLLLQNIPAEEYDVNKVPEEFRSLLINFTNDAVFNGYPDETNAKDKVNRPNLNYNGGHEYGRYTAHYYQFVQTYFFESFPAYDFAFFLDSHVRSTGNYKELFSAILEETKRLEEIDLLSLDPIMSAKPTAEWSEKDSAEPETFFRGRFIVHGISRNLANAMRDLLQNGRNAAHDAFLPAAAIKHDLKIAMFQHSILKRIDGLLFPIYSVPASKPWNLFNSNGAVLSTNKTGWQHGGSFAADTVKWVDDLPLTKWIDDLYQGWRGDEKQCLPGLLLYPVSGR